MQKLYDCIRDFLKKIGEKFGKNKAMQNKAAEDTFGADVDTLKQAEALLGKALKDSAKTVAELKKQGEKTTPSVSKADSSLEDGARGNVKYSYKGVTKTGIRKYKSDFPADMPQEKRIELFKERISTVFNLGMVRLKTDVKRLEIKGDRFTVQKNLYGDDVGRDSEKEARVNALYDLADILATSKFESIDKEESYEDVSIKPKNKAHKDVKYWYKFGNTIMLDGEMYHVTFNIRDKGKEQYQYLIEFRELKKKTTPASNTVNNDLLRTAELSSDKRIPQKNGIVNTQSMQKSENNSQRKNSIKMDDILRQNETLKKVVVKLNSDIQKMKGQNVGVVK